MDAITESTLQEKGLVVLCCAVLEQEVQAMAPKYPHIVATEILEMNLHEVPLRLHEALQRKIVEVEDKHRPAAIALVYGLCGRGLIGIRAQRAPLVVARAHDCVTLFLGSKERYIQQQMEHPEVYWYTPGWIKTGRSPGPEKFERLKKAFAEKFDADEVDYLMEQERLGLHSYHTGAFVDLGIGDPVEQEAYAKKCTQWMGWGFERVQGDRGLLEDLLAGRWDAERFLVVPPGHEIRNSVDGQIMKAVPFEGP